MTALPVDISDGQVERMRAEMRRTIRALMGADRVTQTALASAIGVTQPGLSARLKGDTPFKDDELAKIALVFNREVSDLYRVTACIHDDLVGLATFNPEPERTPPAGDLRLI